MLKRGMGEDKLKLVFQPIFQLESKTKMNVYKVPSAVFEMNIFNIAEESRFAHQYSHFLF